MDGIVESSLLIIVRRSSVGRVGERRYEEGLGDSVGSSERLDDMGLGGVCFAGRICVSWFIAVLLVYLRFKHSQTVLRCPKI